jgi:hypothetical protein
MIGQNICMHFHTQDWDRYVIGNGKAPLLPSDMPPDPDVQYRFLGWKSWEEWLGVKDLKSVQSENKYR